MDAGITKNIQKILTDLALYNIVVMWLGYFIAGKNQSSNDF